MTNWFPNPAALNRSGSKKRTPNLKRESLAHSPDEHCNGDFYFPPNKLPLYGSNAVPIKVAWIDQVLLSSQSPECESAAGKGTLCALERVGEIPTAKAVSEFYRKGHTHEGLSISPADGKPQRYGFDQLANNNSTSSPPFLLKVSVFIAIWFRSGEKTFQPKTVWAQALSPPCQF